MGRPKGLVEVDGVPLLRAHVEAFAAFEVHVVVGFRPDLHRAVLPGHIRVVENRSWRTNAMSDSLRLALATIPAATALVTPVDVPPARPQTVDALIRAGAPAVPVDPSGREGHPVLLDGTALSR